MTFADLSFAETQGSRISVLGYPSHLRQKIQSNCSVSHNTQLTRILCAVPAPVLLHRPLKTCDRCDRRSCQEGWCLCQIVVSWDLFFGACHFCSMKTVDLATSYLFSLSALTAFIVFYCYCMLGKVTQHSISVYFCMLFIILLLYAHK